MADEANTARWFRMSPVSHFETTQWSVVLEAGGTSADAREALESLCRTYWHPLFAYLRRRGFNIDEAQDLVQQFFAYLLQRKTLSLADCQRGRFRSFLLTALRNFVSNERERQRAEKRGGRRVSIDGTLGESKFFREPSFDITPERLYQRQWAVTLLDLVTGRLRQEFAGRGQQRQFDCLKHLLAGRSSERSYAEAAEELQMSPAAAMAAVSRMRRRYREILRSEIARTVSHPEEVDDEIRELFDSLAT